MKQNSLAITIVSVSNQLFDLETASQLTGMHPDLIQEFVNGSLAPTAGTDSDGLPLFGEDGICRLRILADLRSREKLSLRMIRVFCHLLDRLTRAEAEIRFLRNHQR